MKETLEIEAITRFSAKGSVRDVTARIHDKAIFDLREEKQSCILDALKSLAEWLNSLNENAQVEVRIFEEPGKLFLISGSLLS